MNDLSGLTVESLHLDDADDYLLAGSNPIALEKGGIVASPEGSGFAGDFIDMLLVLGEQQKWSIADRSGSEIEENGLALRGESSSREAGRLVP